nr:PEPxxWA-CTERM sorting domain-containing protein [Novosphingobium huizhouense]
MRYAICALVPFTCIALASPVGAATIIGEGAFAAGEAITLADRIALGPGRYRFDLQLSGPADSVGGEITKRTNTVDYCDREGDGTLAYCGSDDTVTAPLLEQLSPTLYRAVIGVAAPYSVTYPDGSRSDYSDSCCTYDVGFAGAGAGRYTFSVSAVPEPATWAIAVVGFGLAGAAMRRRGRRSQTDRPLLRPVAARRRGLPVLHRPG